MNFAEIWKTLSKIDVSDKVEKKMNMSYLSWAWAWGTLMDNFPSAEYNFDDIKSFTDGTAEVWVTVTIEGCSRQMWLPVMDHKNKSIVNPTSRDINDTRMRCITKCLAMFGLGHYIYAGEDLPAQAAESLINDSVCVIASAQNESQLQAIFKEAWMKSQDNEYRAAIKSAYDNRKLVLANANSSDTYLKAKGG